LRVAGLELDKIAPGFDAMMEQHPSFSIQFVEQLFFEQGIPSLMNATLNRVMLLRF
jgi:hypothetical protein